MLFQSRKNCLWRIKYTNEKLLRSYYFSTSSIGNKCFRIVVHSRPMEWLKTVKCTYICICVEMIVCPCQLFFCFSEFKVGTSMTVQMLLGILSSLLKGLPLDNQAQQKSLLQWVHFFQCFTYDRWNIVHCLKKWESLFVKMKKLWLKKLKKYRLVKALIEEVAWLCARSSKYNHIVHQYIVQCQKMLQWIM